jgi:hypothetical protein
VNQAPTANADTPSVPENDTTGVTFNVLANDTDPESDPLSIVSYDDSTIANGGLTSNGGGSFTYVPATHFAGEAFTYRATSVASGLHADAVATITVAATFTSSLLYLTGNGPSIAYGSLYDASWNGFLSWGQHDISVGTVNRTIPAGHELRLELQVGHGDQRVAMTAALPGSLSLTIP